MNNKYIVYDKINKWYYNLLTKSGSYANNDLYQDMVFTDSLTNSKSLAKYIFNKIRYQSDFLDITDVLSFKCNLSCKYCMQQNTNFDDSKILDPELRPNIWESLKNLFHKDKIYIVLTTVRIVSFYLQMGIFISA